MTSVDRFEATIAEWLDAESAYHLPDHLGEVVAQTAVTSQRPTWSSLERWLPMDLTERASTLAPPRIGKLIVIALLVLALAAAAAVIVGSRQPRVPRPFGPATNGTQLASSNGDIYVLDPSTHQRHPIITRPTFDFGTTWFRDGTRFAFLRAAQEPFRGVDAPLSLAVADADGSNVREVASDVHGLDWFDVSPDGAQIAYLTGGGPSSSESLMPGSRDISIVDVATKQVTDLNVPVNAEFPMWRPPDGREIVFRAAGASPALFAVHADGTGLRLISTTRATGDEDYLKPTLSPDGSLVAFTRLGDQDVMNAYVLDIATGSERMLPKPDGLDPGAAVFSPDGRSLAYPRVRDDRTFDIVIAPVDGSSTGTVVGEPMPRDFAGGMRAEMAFAPDGQALVLRYGTDQEAIYTWLPLDGSPAARLDEGVFDFVDVQRLAP